jgi:hypothetical protein
VTTSGAGKNGLTLGGFLASAIAALALAYACLWWSYQRFYGEFGVSPQDAGLAPTGGSTSIAASALQLGVWLMIALLLLAVVPTLAIASLEIAAGYKLAISQPPIQPGDRAAGKQIELSERAIRDALRGFLAGSLAGLLLAAAAAWLYWWLIDAWTGLLVVDGSNPSELAATGSPASSTPCGPPLRYGLASPSSSQPPSSASPSSTCQPTPPRQAPAQPRAKTPSPN